MFGIFDIFYVGYINILEWVKVLGDYLIVGVFFDELN